MNKLLAISLLSLFLIGCQYTESVNYTYNVVSDSASADGTTMTGTADTGVTRGGNSTDAQLDADVGLAP